MDEQNAFLTRLVSIVPVSRRRSRNPDKEEAQVHDASFAYKVRVVRDNLTVEVTVCYKAFLSMFSIGKKKLEYIQRSLKHSGISPRDGRGKHNNRPRKLKDDVINKIKDHISSFKGRKSHYSLKKLIGYTCLKLLMSKKCMTYSKLTIPQWKYCMSHIEIFLMEVSIWLSDILDPIDVQLVTHIRLVYRVRH